jgi:hypothetical protein
MKKPLAILKEQESQDKGFAVVVSTGFGLVIMAIGLTMMGRAMKDSNISSAQKIITRSDAAAQTGSTRYLSLLAKYPKLAGYQDCVSRASDGTCNDTGNTKSWANASAINGLSSEAIALAQQYASVDWKDIDSSNASKGQYKLVSYAPPANGAAGLGTVKIEGRVNQSGTGSSARNDVQTGGSKAEADVAYVPDSTTTTTQIVTLPGTSNPTAFPGLWLKTGPNKQSGTDNCIGQDFIATGLVNSGYLCVKSSASATVAMAETTALNMNDFLPTKPTSTTDKPVYSLGNITSDTTLPRAGDNYATETINGVQTRVYRYSMGSMTGNNDKLTINTVNAADATSSKPAQKVLLYVDGNIDPGGNGEVLHQCGSSPSCDINNFVLYGYGTGTTNPYICNHGSHKIEGFIIAPSYTVGGNASGGGQGAFKGSVWANDWSTKGGPCKGNGTSNQVMLTETGGWNDVIPMINVPSTTQTITTTVTQPAVVGRTLTAADSLASSTSTTTTNNNQQ